MNSLPEVWMRGPIDGISPLLQPVAHALLQASEDVQSIMKDFDNNFLWERPAGVASVAFHLQHLAGVLDRLFTYARGESLTLEQLQHLQDESIEQTGLDSDTLVIDFTRGVTRAIESLSGLTESDLLVPRGIGRKQIPTNVLGLLFHAAEHTQRHTGQLLVTVKIVSDK